MKPVQNQLKPAIHLQNLKMLVCSLWTSEIKCNDVTHRNLDNGAQSSSAENRVITADWLIIYCNYVCIYDINMRI